MRVKRFNEADEVTISSERIDELIYEMKEIISSSESYMVKVDSFMNELSNYISISKKSNTQIDDSISELQLVRSSLEDVMSRMDVVISNLDNYKNNGEKFIYDENN